MQLPALTTQNMEFRCVVGRFCGCDVVFDTGARILDFSIKVRPAGASWNFEILLFFLGAATLQRHYWNDDFFSRSDDFLCQAYIIYNI